MNRNGYKKWRNQEVKARVEIVDRWFKLRITPRKESDGPVEHSYVTGRSLGEAKLTAQATLGVKYLVEAKPISYEQIIHELNRDPVH